jgi:hypothetical protein
VFDWFKDGLTVEVGKAICGSDNSVTTPFTTVLVGLEIRSLSDSTEEVSFVKSFTVYSDIFATDVVWFVVNKEVMLFS